MEETQATVAPLVASVAAAGTGINKTVINFRIGGRTLKKREKGRNHFAGHQITAAGNAQIPLYVSWGFPGLNEHEATMDIHYYSYYILCHVHIYVPVHTYTYIYSCVSMNEVNDIEVVLYVRTLYCIVDG